MIDVPGLPDGLIARPPTLDDIDAVVAVCREEEQHAGAVPHTSAADLSSEWQRPSVDLSEDVVVVDDGERLVGYADQFRGRAWVAVRPSANGRGIGSWLLRWTEANARLRGCSDIGQTIADTARDAQAVVRAHGYEPRYESWVFSYPLEDPLPDLRLPDGVTIRPVRRPAEDRAIHEVVETAFSEWPGRGAGHDFEDWVAEELDRDDVVPELQLVAVEDGRVIGAAVCIVDGDEGWVQQLAVARQHRGRGLGRALLAAAFRGFAEHGMASAGLSTDSRTGAKTLYEHIGMTVTESYTRWGRSLA